MPLLTLRITDEQALWVDQQVRPFGSKADVVRDLIDRARLSPTLPLDTCSTLGPEQGEGPSKAVTSKAVTSKSTSTYRHYTDITNSIDDALAFVRPRLIEWWQVRREYHKSRAIGTERAWKASHDALLQILRVHGPAVVTATVDEALASAWRGIRESYAVLPGRATAAQRADIASAAHPAYQLRY